MMSLWLWILSLPTVPDKMVFCGMQTAIHPEAKKAIQAYITKLYEHPPTLEALVARAESLMPYIEEGLRYIGVPEDLKYIAIQESRLNPYAVSRSLAVGYWQMKDYTAKEVGLVINDTIDERRHLFRSTAGAALYFAKQYMRHRNWFFAIIAYYEGGTGAIPYIDSAFIGKEEICVQPNSHWYALRAIAHKLTFEALIRRRVYGLSPKAYSGPPMPVYEVAATYGLSSDSLLLLNPWLLKPVFPGSRAVTFYVPADSFLTEVPQEPLKALFLPPPLNHAHPSIAVAAPSLSDSTLTPSISLFSLSSSAPPPHPKAAASSYTSPSPLRPGQVARLPLSKEPLLGQEWAYPPPSPLPDKYQRWNPFHTGEGPILITPPRKATFHIVQQGESPQAIAEHYRVPIQSLLSHNRLANPDSTLPRGLRLYLRTERPYDEAPICYQW
jgi:membrane-bound lytic murein transglycosylase D